jgi:AcrR family transcriptional regulator
MTHPAMRRSPLREQSRQAIREQITAAAMELFRSHGFEQTTVSEIAAAAGISSRSVFRHFATKEDIVTASVDEIGGGIAVALAGRPPGESPWVALRRAMDGHLDDLEQDADGYVLERTRLLFRTASLRAAMLNKRARWIEAMAPDIVPRLTGRAALREVQAHAVVASALACLTTAVEHWARSNGTENAADLMDATIAAVRT